MQGTPCSPMLGTPCSPMLGTPCSPLLCTPFLPMLGTSFNGDFIGDGQMQGRGVWTMPNGLQVDGILGGTLGDKAGIKINGVIRCLPKTLVPSISEPTILDLYYQGESDSRGALALSSDNQRMHVKSDAKWAPIFTRCRTQLVVRGCHFPPSSHALLPVSRTVSNNPTPIISDPASAASDCFSPATDMLPSLPSLQARLPRLLSGSPASSPRSLRKPISESFPPELVILQDTAVNDGVRMREHTRRAAELPNPSTDSIAGVSVCALEIEAMLSNAFLISDHPLSELVDEAARVFQSSYRGVGSNPMLLTTAVSESRSLLLRIMNEVYDLCPQHPNRSRLVAILEPLFFSRIYSALLTLYRLFTQVTRVYICNLFSCCKPPHEPYSSLA